MTTEPLQPVPESTPANKTSRVGVIVFLAVYWAATIAICIFAHPIGGNVAALCGIALLPAVAYAILQIPRAMRMRPRSLAVVFHLILFPLAAAITIGLPTAFLARLIVTEYFSK